MANVDAFFSRMNPLVRTILRSPVHWLASSGLALITVTGRRTGRRYSIPVGYQREGDRVVILVSEARRKQWWRNYREPGRVEVLLRRRALAGEASVLAPDDDAFREACERSFRRIPGLGRAFGLQFDAAAGLTSAQLERLRENAAVVVIELDRAPEPERQPI
ncbi:MAG: nitroreductase family deazaflavin-dependent oxidoreductase [Deltaproteobacteria bacterium]|jgi:deazaflavin-dependent oxidoreductase (nitroreductase family)|nr:nitroreductase family deazaflavin-dependent oxidoreductase [Deltaproteobacteria bacterium]MBW2696868.1 nitroreductase family deazaflavin-dependent oxidoreductase [Deltaproteobacteria bacterium]